MLAELVEAIQSACDEKGQDSSGFLSQVDAVVGDSEVLSFCVWQGPSPSFSSTLVDVFVLTRSAIIDVEMTEAGVGWGVIKLDHLSSITNHVTAGDFVSFTFNTVAGADWGLEARREDENAAREFVAAVKTQWLR